MKETVTIPAQFNGPPGSGNGGYSAGAFADFIGGPTEVTHAESATTQSPDGSGTPGKWYCRPAWGNADW